MTTPPAVAGAIRLGVAAAVLAVVAAQVGSGPFEDALTRTTVAAMALALVVNAAVTACCAWRWVLVARRLGLALEPRTALPAYYRAQLVNLTVPGGVVGDVQRAWRHGEAAAARGAAARAVVWERALGQLALVAATLVALVVMPSVLREHAVAWAPVTLLAGVAVVVGAGLLWRRRAPSGRALTVLATDLRTLLGGRGAWQAVALSLAAVAGHLLVLLVAMRVAGVGLPLLDAVPLLLAVLLASALPTHLAGWGPREGAAALVFGAAGVGAAAGVTVAAVYGVLVLVAAVPGALVLLVDVLPQREGVRA